MNNPFEYNSENLKRPTVTWLMRIALLAGCLYTGLHNYALYHRGLSTVINHDARGFVAFGIAFILEASFYFSVEGRGHIFVTDQQRTASGYGAIAIFLVIALNTVTDHAMNIGRVREGDWLSWWATYGSAAMIVCVVGYIGYLKAHSPEAMLAAEGSKAEAMRVRAVQSAQRKALSDPDVLAAYDQHARLWAKQVTGSVIEPKREVIDLDDEPLPRLPRYVNGEADDPKA